MLAATYAKPNDTQWALDFLRKSPAAELVRRGIWYIRDRRPDGWALRTDTGMTIIASGDVERDGRRWLHISMSYPDRVPSYDEMIAGMRAILGDDREAYQVFPPRARWVNIDAYCLHLWHCLDADVLPDFTRGGRSI